MISGLNLLICRFFFPISNQILIRIWTLYLWNDRMISVQSEHGWFMWRGIAAQKRTEPKSSKRSKKDSVHLCLQITSQVKTWKLSLRPFKDLVPAQKVLRWTRVESMFLIHIIPVFFRKRTTSWIPVPPSRVYRWIKASLFFLSSSWYQAVTYM